MGQLQRAARGFGLPVHELGPSLERPPSFPTRRERAASLRGPEAWGAGRTLGLALQTPVGGPALSKRGRAGRSASRHRATFGSRGRWPPKPMGTGPSPSGKGTSQSRGSAPVSTSGRLTPYWWWTGRDTRPRGVRIHAETVHPSDLERSSRAVHRLFENNSDRSKESSPLGGSNLA